MPKHKAVIFYYWHGSGNYLIDYFVTRSPISNMEYIFLQKNITLHCVFFPFGFLEQKSLLLFNSQRES